MRKDVAFYFDQLHDILSAYHLAYAVDLDAYGLFSTLFTGMESTNGIPMLNNLTWLECSDHSKIQDLANLSRKLFTVLCKESNEKDFIIREAKILELQSGYVYISIY